MGMLPIAAAVVLGSVDVSAQLVLNLDANFERNRVEYHCEGMEPFAVDFINAAPNFLAIVPIEGQSLVFVNVLSGSGARYASGRYEFWTKGGEATLTDLMADPPTPVSCSEANETP